MPMYLARFSYTSESWAKMIEKPEDRSKIVGQLAEAAGGKLHGLWYSFGEQDGYCLVEAPNNVSMSAVSVAISASGALSSLDTTVLLTIEETLSVLKKAGSLTYRPPGS